MPGDCPAALASSCGSPVENIPLQAERDSGGEQKVFAFPPERCSPSERNTVRNHNGMVFGFRPESRSPSTGFPSTSEPAVNCAGSWHDKYSPPGPEHQQGTPVALGTLHRTMLEKMEETLTRLTIHHCRAFGFRNRLEWLLREDFVRQPRLRAREKACN